ncbi:Transthyretin-like protein [Dirofilaria immitis]
MSISITIIAAKTKSVGVSGTIICDGKPVNNGDVELYDNKYAMDAGSLLAKAKTDEQGRFRIAGSSKKSIFNPQFTVSHKCRSKLCTRRMYLPIPEKYSTFGSKPREIFDIGVIEVKTKFPTETRICPT